MPHTNKFKPSRIKHNACAGKYRKNRDAKYRRLARENGTFGIPERNRTE